MSNEIIKVLDHLAQKFGLAIDWTAENIMPYVTELVGRVVTYKIIMCCINMAMGVAMIVAAVLVAKYCSKNYEANGWMADDYCGVSGAGIFVIVMTGCVFIAGIVLTLHNFNSIVQWAIIPEIPLMEMVSQMT